MASRAKGDRTREGSDAAIVRRYIERRPVVRDALAMGIVNLSALTRQVLDDTEATSEEAVLAACRRYPAKAAKPAYEEAIRRIMARSKLEVRTRVAVLTARPSWKTFAKLEQAMHALRGRDHPTHVIHGSESLTVITDEAVVEQMEAIIGEEDLMKTRRGLVEVNLRSPESVEDVPGILSFLSTSLSSRGVNFVDVISCYKDNMFLIEEGDLFATFEVLNGLIER